MMCGHVDMWSTISKSQQIIIPQRRFMYTMYIPQCGLHINYIDDDIISAALVC